MCLQQDGNGMHVGAFLYLHFPPPEGVRGGSYVRFPI